jgi:hypothetical protein
VVREGEDDWQVFVLRHSKLQYAEDPVVLIPVILIQVNGSVPLSNSIVTLLIERKMCSTVVN